LTRVVAERGASGVPGARDAAARSRRLRRRGVLALSGSVVAVAAAVCVAIGLTPATGTPAYAVATGADGSVTVTANYLGDPADANRRLRAAGVAAIVIPAVPPAQCPTDRRGRVVPADRGGQGDPLMVTGMGRGPVTMHWMRDGVATGATLILSPQLDPASGKLVMIIDEYYLPGPGCVPAGTANAQPAPVASVNNPNPPPAWATAPGRRWPLSVGGFDAQHLYAVFGDCAGGGACPLRLRVSADGGRTWTAHVVTGLQQLTAHSGGVFSALRYDGPAGPLRVPAPPDFASHFQEVVSRDGGASWQQVARDTTPVDRVPAGGWAECTGTAQGACTLYAVDPATLRAAPLAHQPGLTRPVNILPVASSHLALWLPGGELWLDGYDAARHPALAVSTDRGHSWTVHPFTDVPAGPPNRIQGHAEPVSRDGQTVYAVVTSAAGTAVYRSGDAGHTWQRLDRAGSLPDSVSVSTMASIVLPDGTHAVNGTSPDVGLVLWTSRDGGARYAPAGTGLPPGAYGITMLDDGTYLTYLDTGVVFRSTDARHWSSLRLW
ncbi:MAG TPA: sialidase family protein, partial [Rugosimonospora sp.]|nr:sialidase family protein [Rugosimonospora sp.]